MANCLLISGKLTSNRGVSGSNGKLIKSQATSRLQSVNSLELNSKSTTPKQQSDCEKISNLCITVTSHMSKQQSISLHSVN